MEMTMEMTSADWSHVFYLSGFLILLWFLIYLTNKD